jgi:spore coat polysaccharide biosynthesis protein SpsF
MKIGALISIREKSVRFPKKVLKEMHDQNVTEHLIDRVLMAKNPDLVIIATSDHPDDHVFEEMANKKSVEIFNGDQEDKLLRYLQICNHYELDGVIIIDGDDTFCFPEIIDQTVNHLSNKNHDVVFWRELPLGAASSGITKAALEKVIEIKADDDTEVWGGYFTTGDLFNVGYYTPEDSSLCHPDVRMTLDYEEDYRFFKAVFDELYPVNKSFSSYDIMDLLINKKPEIVKINASAQLKYEENISKKLKVTFKKD